MYNSLFETLVNPSCHIPDDVSKIHGIDDKMVKGAPTWDKVWSKVEMLIAGKTILAYNSDFDIRMMQQSSNYHGMSFICQDNQCIMDIYSQYCQSERWISLTNALHNEGVGGGQNHRAASDCRLCAALIKSIAGL